MSKPSLLVATPAYNNQVCAAYTNSLLGLGFVCMQQGIGFAYAHTTSQSLITLARNDLVQHFLHNTQCTHLLFIDGDMTFQAPEVLRMLETGHEVIAAVCPKKKIDWSHIQQAAIQNPDLKPETLAQLGASYQTFSVDQNRSIDIQTPFEVSKIGTGIMLIHRSVFEKLLPMTRKDNQGRVHYFESGVDEAGNFLSEDLYFCAQVRKLGIPIYAAAWLEIGHIGNYEHRGNIGQLSEFKISL